MRRFRSNSGALMYSPDKKDIALMKAANKRNQLLYTMGGLLSKIVDKSEALSEDDEVTRLVKQLQPLLNDLKGVRKEAR